MLKDLKLLTPICLLQSCSFSVATWTSSNVRCRPPWLKVLISSTSGKANTFWRIPFVHHPAPAVSLDEPVLPLECFPLSGSVRFLLSSPWLCCHMLTEEALYSTFSKTILSTYFSHVVKITLLFSIYAHLTGWSRKGWATVLRKLYTMETVTESASVPLFRSERRSSPIIVACNVIDMAEEKLIKTLLRGIGVWFLQDYK